jgi:hypothetical protein
MNESRAFSDILLVRVPRNVRLFGVTSECEGPGIGGGGAATESLSVFAQVFDAPGGRCCRNEFSNI